MPEFGVAHRPLRRRLGHGQRPRVTQACQPEHPSSQTANLRSVNCALCADVLNFLARLPDGTVLKRLDGRHFGDEPRYNHYVNKVIWSPDEQYIVQVHRLEVRQRHRRCL